MRRRFLLAPCLLLALVAAACNGAPGPDSVALKADALVSEGTIRLGAYVPTSGTFEVTVADSDQNVVPTSVDALHVYVTSGTCGSEFVRVSLLETGDDTGEFTGAVKIALGEMVDGQRRCRPGDDTIEVRENDSVTVTYRDPNANPQTCGSAVLNETAQAVVNFNTPDLVVESLSVTPAAPISGGVITVAASIRNQGGGSAGATTAKAVFGKMIDEGYGPEFVQLGVVGLDSTPPLDPDDADSLTPLTYTIPSGLNGSYRVFVKADSALAVAELDEGNNEAFFDINVVGPDLTVEWLAVNTTTQISGGVITVTGSIRNQPGGSAAGASTVQAVFGKMIDEGYGPEFVQLGVIGDDSTPALEPNGAYAFRPLSYTIPPGLNGWYRVVVRADAGYSVTERDDFNNEAFVDINIVGPDLTVEWLAVSTTTQISGGVITVTGSIRNQPGGSAAGASTVRAVFGKMIDEGYGPEFVQLGVIGDDSTPPLEPNGAYAFRPLSYTIPPGLSGWYRVFVRADAGYSVPERDDFNNEAFVDINIVGPDLTVESLSVTPPEQIPGGVITVTGSIRNQPGGSAAGASTVRVVFGKMIDEGYGPEFVQLGVIGDDSTPPLDPNGADAFSLAYTIPSVPRGAYKIIAIADWATTVAERGEANNTRMIDVTVN